MALTERIHHTELMSRHFLVPLILFLSALRISAEQTPETIFPEAWVRELLHHPLLCTAYAAQKDGPLAYDIHHFQNEGIALSPDQSKTLSVLLSNPTSFTLDKGSPSNGAFSPDVLLRLENEQQFVDLLICFKTACVQWYANGEISPESADNPFRLKKTALKAIDEIIAKLFQETSS